MLKDYFNIKKITIALGILISFAFNNLECKGQINAEQVLTIGRNVLSMDDYMLAIQYFNQAIKAKPYLSDPYFFRALAKLNLEDYQGAETDCTKAIENNKFKTEAYKLRGFARQILGKDSLAVEDYNIGLTYNPIDKYFLFYKAVALTELKKYDSADSTFSVLLRQYPRFDEGFTARARLNLEKKDTIAALDDIEISLGISKSQINPYLMKAEIAWQRKDWNSASSAIDAAIRLRPELPDLYVNRAFVRYNSDDFFGAMSDYNYAIELDPSNAAAIFNRALLRYEVKDLEKAEDDMTSVIRLEPENVHAYFNRGLIRLEEGKDKEALQDFQLIERKFPRFYPVYYAMAEAQRNLGNLREAATLANHAEQLVANYVHDPDKNPLDRPAIASAKSNSRNNIDKEDESETEVMDRFNHLVTISQPMDQSLSYNEKIKGRVQDRDVSVEMEPTYAITLAAPPETLKNLSNYFRELDDVNQMNLIRQKLYLSPGLQSSSYGNMMDQLFELSASFERNGNASNLRPIDYLLQGVVETMLKNYDNALKNLDQALALNPQFVVAYMARGYARYANAITNLKLSQHSENEAENILERTEYTVLLQEALSDFDKVLQLDPRVVYSWFNKGNIYFEAQDFTSAMQCYSEAIKIDPSFGEAYFNRGLSYLKSGNKNQAFADLSKAGELGVIPSYNILKRMK